MDQITLQQRIEERAAQRLYKDLVDACNKEKEIQQLFGTELFKPQLNAWWHRNSFSHDNEVRLNNEFTKKLFEQKLPEYIKMVTDEILQKIDEIDYLVNKQEEFGYS